MKNKLCCLILLLSAITSQLFANGEVYDGKDLSTKSFFMESLRSSSWISAKLIGTDFSCADLYGSNFTGADLSGADCSEADMSSCIFIGAILRNTNFKFAKLGKADFSKADLRDTVLSLNSTSKTQNTIWTDGEIKNFAMESIGDNFSIRKYIPATTGGAMINAKIVEDATISGGAVLTLEEGAVLEVSSGKTLTVSDNGEIVFDVDAATDDTNIILNSGSKLVFGDNSKLTINLTGEVSETDPLYFTVIKAADDSYVLGLDTLPKDNIILNVNGTAYDTSKWGINFNPTTGNLDINVNVPEPASIATIFAALALGFAAYRKRK